MRTTTMMGIAAALVVTVVPASAQRAGQDGVRMDRDRGRVGAPLERRVERVLARRDALGLTEAQVAELEALRSDIAGALEPLRAQGRSLRSESRDRSGEPDEVRARMQDLRAQGRAFRARGDTVLAGLQQRFEQAVTPLQRREVDRAGRSDRRPGDVRRSGRRAGDRVGASRGAPGRIAARGRIARARGAVAPGVARRRVPATVRQGPGIGARNERAWPGRDARTRRIGWRVG